jgi:diguanylate cyclase (GGDEF)-like protein
MRATEIAKGFIWFSFVLAIVHRLAPAKCKEGVNIIAVPIAMSILRRLAVCVSFVAFHAGAVVLPPGTYPFRTYGTEAGLGNLSVMRLAQDSTGFIWVATQDGVYRYDGNRFMRFGLEQGLPSTFASTLVAGRNNVVWVATGSGVARFDSARFVVANDLPHAIAGALSIDPANRLWVAMPQGLFVEQSNGHFALAPGWGTREATAVWCAPNGDVLAAANGTVGRLSHRAWQWTDIGRDRIDALAIDREGRTWARSANHLWSKAANESAFRDESSSLPATSNNGYLALNARGDVWVPTDRGIAIHDANGWRVVGREEGLPTDWARDVLEDREGSIWVASLGVHRMLGRGEFTIYRRANGLPNEVVWCFHWARDGHFLVGTDLGLARSEWGAAAGENHSNAAGGGGATPRTAPWSVIAGTEKTQIRSFVEDENGVLWAGGSPAEVLRIEPWEGRRFPSAQPRGTRGSTPRVGGRAGPPVLGISRFGEAEGVHARTIMRIARDRSGAIWAATRGGGLLRKGKDELRFSRVAIPNGTADEDFRDVIEDPHGRIWATGQNGLARFENGAWRRFTSRDGLVRDHVSYIRETPGGDLWIAYFEPFGVTRVRPAGDAIRIMQTISAGKVYIVGEDAQHRLWIGTGAGIDVVTANSIDHYSAGDGLAGDDTDAQAFLCDERGEVFVGTSSGFSRFVARRDPPSLGAPPIVITNWKLSDRRDFDASFSALSYFKPALVEYETRLAGLDDAWQRATEPHARFSRLPHGEYRFEARARLRPGPWSAPASVGFTILPAWWQTTASKVAAVLLIIALLFLGYRWRVAILRRRNAELEALVEQRTHELALANESLMNISVTDALTGTKNRRYLTLCMPEYTSETLRRYEVLERPGADATRVNADLVFLMIDIDHFKEINDRYGHAGGDAVLIGLKKLLGTIMRESDTLVRWGGEEFLFIARNTSRGEAATIAERIRATVEEHEFAIDDITFVRLTCSIGFAAFPFLAEDAARIGWEEVVDVADVCLYAAKRAGRNCWVGGFVNDCSSPDTIIARVRQSAADLIASGELTIVSSSLGAFAGAAGAAAS